MHQRRLTHAEHLSQSILVGAAPRRQVWGRCPPGCPGPEGTSHPRVPSPRSAVRTLDGRRLSVALDGLPRRLHYALPGVEGSQAQARQVVLVYRAVHVVGELDCPLRY